MKKILLTTLMAVGLAAPAFAGDKNPPVEYLPEPSSLYSAGEIQLDLYATHSFNDPLGPDDWGGGGGLNYFISRYFGLGVEGQFYDTLATFPERQP